MFQGVEQGSHDVEALLCCGAEPTVRGGTIECRRVAAEVAPDQNDVAQVGFARPWPQIAQLDKAAKLVYGWIVRMSSSR